MTWLLFEALRAPMFSAYLVGFIVATAICLGAAWRARQVAFPPETRRALVSFFLGAGGWAASYIGFLLVSDPVSKRVFYQASLIVGFTTVWTWLWFCSSYSGYDLHQREKVQKFAAVVFSLVVALKLTNPIHGLYYELVPSGGGFEFVVMHGTLYWVVMALAYALAAAGYFMLFEIFLETGARTGPLVTLTVLTGAPAILNVVGHVNENLLDVTHEPLGVALFAIGVLVVYETQLSVVQVTGTAENPSITVDKGGYVRGVGGNLNSEIPCLTEKSVGKPLNEVAPGLAAALKDEEAWETDICGERRIFEPVPTGRPRGDAAERIVLNDVTEQRKREQRLEKAKEKAEMAKLEAEEASRMKSAMLANMSHEIRTPLTSIIGFAEAIGDETESGDQIGRFAELIEGSGERLLDTLDTVLNLSKLEAGQMDLSSETVWLGDLAETVAEELRPDAEEKGLSLQVDVEEVPARANKGGIEIILQNLISNAVKYTEEGTVWVRAYQDESGPALEVEDTGIGMNPDVAESFFRPFRQESEGLSRRYEGTGVGLAVTKKAAEQMGATIELETEKGKGSRFTVRFPASGGASVSRETVVEANTSEGTGAGDGVSGKDDPSVSGRAESEGKRAVRARGPKRHRPGGPRVRDQ